MNASPETRQSLLLRIRDADDHIAWREFVGIYAPLIHAYGMRRGLQDADAADVAQTVLQSVAQSIPGFDYDPSKGSFRGWLFTLTRNNVFKALSRRKRIPLATGDSAFHDVLKQKSDEKSDEDAWDRHHERQLFHWAVERVRVDFRDSTWNAFWAVAVEGKSAPDVACELELSVGAVYIAKSRVTARIRQLIESVEAT